MKTRPHLPEYRLAIFEETEEERVAREGREADAQRQRDADAQAQRERDAQTQRDADAQRQRDADTAAAKKKADDAAEAARLRGTQGQFESREDYERRIGELNDENKNRRQENRDLKGTVSVLERRTIMADVREAFSKANPLTDSIGRAAMNQFLADHADDIKIDQKTGETKGLEKLVDWKKANPDFFKPEETAEQKTAREAAEKRAADDAKRGNRSASSASRGAGAGAGEVDTGGLPDLTSLTPPERKKALDDWKRGLRTGGGSGYAKASSRH